MIIRLEFENVKEHSDYCLHVVKNYSSAQLIPLEEYRRLENEYNEQANLFHQARQKVINWEKFYERHKKTIDEIREKIKDAKKIEEMDLTVRTFNCLKAEQINTVDELINNTEIDLLKIQNFGRKSLDEVKEKLKEMNLSLLKTKVKA